MACALQPATSSSLRREGRIPTGGGGESSESTMERQGKKGVLAMGTVLAKRRGRPEPCVGALQAEHVARVSPVRQDWQDRELGRAEGRLGGGDSIQERESEACCRAGSVGMGKMSKKPWNAGHQLCVSPEAAEQRGRGITCNGWERDLAAVSTPFRS